MTKDSPKESSPPILFLRLFRWFCNPDYAEDIEGDLLERFEKKLEKKGVSHAKWNFIRDVFRLFRPGLIRSLQGTQKLNYYGMIKHDLLMGWRSLLKNKSYSILNISGLALGITVAIIISLWIQDELSYNKNYDNYSKIGLLQRNEIRDGEISTNYVMPTGLGTLLFNEYRNYFEHVSLVRSRAEERVLGYSGVNLTETGYFLQQEGPELLSLEMISGDRKGLKDLRSILISESLGKRLFKEEDPQNKIIKMNGSHSMTVVGVYKDIPKNAHFNDASYLAPVELFLYGWSDLNVWDNYNMRILVQLKDGYTFEDVSASIKDAMIPHLPPRSVERKPALFLSPMSDWHLYNDFKEGTPVISERLKIVWFYGVIGVFVLLLACINFINLTTARAGSRLKEIGVRKSLGARKGKLIFQFLLESAIVTTLSMVIALCITIISLSWFNELTDKQLVLPYMNSWFWGLVLVFSIITTLISGSYPAFYLSSMQVVKSLKGKLKTGKFSSLPRKTLVVFQFTISITLIISTLLVNKQIEFAKSRPVGYERDRLISVKPGSPDYYGKYDILREKLISTGVVEEITEANYSITSTLGWNDDFSWPGKDPNQQASFNTIVVSPEYGKTIGLEFVEGRDFSRDLATDENAIVINESAAALLKGLEKPIVGKIIKFNQEYFGGPYFKIIGVTKDMVKGSPFQETDPGILFPSNSDLGWLYIRISPGVDLRNALTQIEEAYHQIIPTDPFDFKFADETYNAKFNEEERIFKLGKVLSVLAIFISCLGLFGLVSFVAEQRTKEIGIRKVLGASVLQLWKLLSKDFVVLVILSCLISVPLTWYFMQQWIEQYAYKTSINLPILLSGSLLAILVTLITVSFRTIRSAMENPVNSLKDE